MDRQSTIFEGFFRIRGDLTFTLLLLSFRDFEIKLGEQDSGMRHVFSHHVYHVFRLFCDCAKTPMATTNRQQNTALHTPCSPSRAPPLHAHFWICFNAQVKDQNSPWERRAYERQHPFSIRSLSLYLLLLSFVHKMLLRISGRMRSSALMFALQILLSSLRNQIAMANDTNPPNIVFILAEDMGHGDLPSYGHPYSRTPNLDKLVSQGTKLNRFYVTGTTCNPSRTGLMTGRHPASFPSYPADFGLPEGLPTLTKLLRDEAGYRTGHVGKWHLGPEDLGDQYGMDTVRVIGMSQSAMGRDNAVFDAALDFIHQSEDDDRPFYLNIWSHIAHSPVRPPKNLVDMFDDVEVDRADFPDVHMQQKFDEVENLGGDLTEGMRNYLADLYSLDLQIGRVMDALEELGIADNTLIAMTADHGAAPVMEEMQSHPTNMMGWAGGLRGGKHDFYEGGMREPFIVRWPGHIPAGVTNTDSVVWGMDWLPTICEIAGVDIERDHYDGESVVDILQGQSQRSRANPLVWKVPHFNIASKRVIMYGFWKLHVWTKKMELYNLRDDPEESLDVEDDYPEIANALESSLRAWEASLPDHYATGRDRAIGFDVKAKPFVAKPPNHLLALLINERAPAQPRSTPPTDELITSVTPGPITCSPCRNIPSPGMVKYGTQCDDDDFVLAKCHFKTARWIADRYCERSCYFHGYPYDEETKCCMEAANENEEENINGKSVTAKPTAMPTPRLPPTDELITNVRAEQTPCSPCTNIPSPGMVKYGTQCDDDDFVLAKCHFKTARWIADRYCERSCYLHGYPYDEETKCCMEATTEKEEGSIMHMKAESVTAKPTAMPTVMPTPKPSSAELTASPTQTPTSIPTTTPTDSQSQCIMPGEICEDSSGLHDIPCCSDYLCINLPGLAGARCITAFFPSLPKLDTSMPKDATGAPTTSPNSPQPTTILWATANNQLKAVLQQHEKENENNRRRLSG